MEEQKKSILNRFVHSKILTIVEGIIIIPFAVLLLLALTHIPVISVGNILVCMALQINVVTLVLLILSILLCLASRTKIREFIVCAACAAFVFSMIISISNIRIASKEGVELNIGEALAGRKDTGADIEIESYYDFNGEKCGLSIWKPQNVSAPAPILIFVHGGGWATGDRFLEYVTSHCKYFSEQGYLAVSIDYPLSTDDRHLWNQQEEVVGRAVWWIAEHAEEYGGDKNRIVISGESAGGNLTINVATRINNGSIGEKISAELPAIKAIAALYPAVYPEATYNHSDPLFRASQIDLIAKHFGGSPEEYPERYETITSALLADKDYTPPILLIYGSNDHYVPTYSTKNFIEVLKEKEITYKTVVVPFSDHIFDLLGGNIGSQIYEQTSVKWFGQHNK